MELLEQLHAAFAIRKLVKFDHVIFCPTVPSTSGLSKGIHFCPSILTTTDLIVADQTNHSTDTVAITGLTMQKDFAARWQELDSISSYRHAAQVHVLTSVEQAMEYVKSLSENKNIIGKEDEVRVHALVTGSVHLVGRTLGILEGGVDAL
jgi:folylpolyglutamate synthase